MVICKYFQQGCCRFGQNCRFEHTYSSKYSYHASTTASTQQASPSTLTDEQLVNQVQSDIQAALKGGQWILSCYSPYKEKACFPGITDLSQEEARLIIYESKAKNTLDQAVNYMNNLFTETRQKYEQLLQPSAQIVKVLRSLYNGEAVTSPFGPGNQSGFGSNASSLFRSAIQSDPFKSNTPFGQPTPNVFAQQNNSVFGQQQSNSVFGQANNASSNAFGSNPQSIFAQASQNIFGQSQPSNVFQTQPTNAAAKSIFAQANQNTFGQQPTNPPSNVFASQQPSVFATNQQPNVFATNQQPNVFATNQKQDVFGTTQQQQNVFAPNSQQQNPFGVQQNQTTNVFQQNDPFKITSSNVDVFGINKNAFQDKPTDDETVYSKIEDLSPSDLEAFNSAEFKLGFIPMLPPPHSLCI